MFVPPPQAAAINAMSETVRIDWCVIGGLSREEY
jgi:hypothetical protein